eukprot:CAMPEP_0201870392 /NCGR_PEP_ID=MMETSP0902-20130614/3493_1 /ASSEMBLY_ACC=CAM_ASM_000551 /TAXON_ID=420261 /ORGANISM="Thalassiosira antarctica, Strain CCMP982" /LENGTH=420 /DNA_ID=CAMNT_0048395985 /DNA_START=88 /DNA_END=1350 /DNA_ORIENTATION=-
MKPPTLGRWLLLALLLHRVHVNNAAGVVVREESSRHERHPSESDAEESDHHQQAQVAQGHHRRAEEEQEDQEDESDEHMAKLIETILGSRANISDYYLQFTTCTSITDEVNKNYTNDGYSFSHQSFLHYHSCKDTNGGYFSRHFWGAFMCHRVSHVVRMDDYFQSTKGCVQDYCDECTAACDNDGSCSSTCLEQCEGYYDLTEGSMDYYGCAGPYNATDGSAYYFGPVCSISGGVTKSYFLDEECEISADSSDAIQFNVTPPSLNMYKFVDSICSSCAGGDVCENLYDSSFHCSDRTMKAMAVGQSTSLQPSQSSQEGGDRWEFADEVCYKTSTDSQKEHYQVRSVSTHTRQTETALQQRLANVLIAFGIAVMTLGSVAFMFIWYKYHVRHSSSLCADSLCSDSTDAESLDASQRIANER